MPLNGFQRLQIDRRNITKRLQIMRDVEDGRLRRSIREGRHGGMKDSHSELHAFQITERRLAAVAMSMKFNRNVAGVLQNNRDQRSRALRSQKSSDVFEANAPRLDRRRLPSLPRVI